MISFFRQFLNGSDSVNMSSLLRSKLTDLVPNSDTYGHSSGYGHSSSGYGHSGSYSSGYDDCCPPVVDPLTYIALLSFLAAAVYLLNEQIAMSNLMVRRKREVKNVFIEGEN